MSVTEDYFYKGPGRNFKDAYQLAKDGASPTDILPRLLKDLRKELRGNLRDILREGIRIASVLGVVSNDAQLPLPFHPSSIDVEAILKKCRSSDDPHAKIIERVLRKAINRLTYGESPLTVREFLVEICLETVETKFLSPVLSFLPDSTSEDRSNWRKGLKHLVQQSLEGSDIDIIDSLEAGLPVKRNRPGQKKISTEEKLTREFTLGANF